MQEHAETSRNIDTVNSYLDGFRRNDHEQILSCLTDDIEWTVFGAFHLTGKEAYDKAIDGAPEFVDPPELEVVRMVEEGDVVMAELKRDGEARRGRGDAHVHGRGVRHARRQDRRAPCVGDRTQEERLLLTRVASRRPTASRASSWSR